MRTARNEINVTPTAKLWRSTAVSQPSAREQQKSPRQPVRPLSLSLSPTLNKINRLPAKLNTIK